MNAPTAMGPPSTRPRDAALLTEMLRRMLRIRRFEECAIDLHRHGEIAGPLHTSIGEEATVVGACLAVRPDDYMTGTHRSHGHPIGKGASLTHLMAELLGRATGVCKGKGGSMHLADFSVGSLGESGIVGSAMPVAVGAALSSQLRSIDRIVLCFFGDGGANSGPFHESLNLAAVWRLPVVFLCENNGYAVTAPLSQTTAVADIASRAGSYDMPGVIVDGQDVLAVYDAVCAAAQRARSGAGPTLVEAKTYRYREHAEFGGLKLDAERPPGELESWKARDPILMLRRHLLAEGRIPAARLDEIADEVLAEVATAVDFAQASPEPEPDELFTDVFAPSSTGMVVLS
jgi:pyruvate dehydrogenase E1 component alpha subunit